MRSGPARRRDCLLLVAILMGLGWGRLLAVRGESRVESLRLVPEKATLRGAQASQRFVVLATYPDRLERDVTRRSVFSVLDPAIAEVDQEGRVRARAGGRTVLQAEIDGQATRATLRIKDSQLGRRFSFPADAGRIFTKHGCNSSDCHGGVKGRGGLRLSPDALSPQEDYQWIVRGGGYQVLTDQPLAPLKSRINLREPRQSLLLLKPTFTVPHGGGKHFGPDSPDYHTLLNWIRREAPYIEEVETLRVERIEVFPREAVLDSKGEHRILVTAHLADGSGEDITEQVRYESLDPEVVKVTSQGRVKAVATGETVVMIRSVGHTASVRFGVIVKPVANYPSVQRNNFIDGYIFDKLRRFQIVPSGLSTDEEFLRRVCLDVTGTLPPPQRVREFLASQDLQKREKLIEMLLNSPEYTDYWTFRFADLLMVKGHYGWTHLAWDWIRKSVALNKPYDRMARESIAAQGYDGPSRLYLGTENKPAPVERMVAEKFRVFMGRRLDCAQCHNHPYGRWTQDQFWGLAAFFGRMTNTQWFFDNVVFDHPQGHEVDFGEIDESLTFREVIHPRGKQKVIPSFPDGRVLPESARDDPRRELAQWMTSHPDFAEAAVNRMWRHFFGRGIVDPVDDFRLGNPPTHPRLLKALARDFEGHHYDLKHLIRSIVRSRTYQLSSRVNETNRSDRINYSHAQPRSLEAEVLLDAISFATGVPEVFKGSGSPLAGTAPPGTRAINLKYPASYPSRFLEVYGRPLRNAIPERSGKANLSQALHMLVGSTYTEKLDREGGRIDRLLKNGASDGEIIEELYLATLSRFPTEEEQTGLQKIMGRRSSRREAFTDLFWALLSSREFVDNH